MINWEITYNIEGQGVVGAKIIINAAAPNIAKKILESMHNNNPKLKIQWVNPVY